MPEEMAAEEQLAVAVAVERGRPEAMPPAMLWQARAATEFQHQSPARPLLMAAAVAVAEVLRLTRTAQEGQAEVGLGNRQRLPWQEKRTRAEAEAAADPVGRVLVLLADRVL